jgi:hypothetical protein
VSLGLLSLRFLNGDEPLLNERIELIRKIDGVPEVRLGCKHNDYDLAREASNFEPVNGNARFLEATPH